MKQIAKNGKYLIIATSLLVLAGCQQDEPAEKSSDGTQDLSTIKARYFSTEQITRGAKVFQQHCAQCHGPEAQGHPDWQTPSAGKFAAAPPLNGTGNGRKRSRVELIYVIRTGVSRNGVAIMPGWGKRLGKQDIEDVIMWFQALWPTEVYKQWLTENPNNLATAKTADKANTKTRNAVGK